MRCQIIKKIKSQILQQRMRTGTRQSQREMLWTMYLRSKLQQCFCGCLKYVSSGVNMCYFTLSLSNLEHFYLPVKAKRSKGCKIKNPFVNNLEGYCTLKMIYFHLPTFKIIQKSLSYS